MSTEERGDEMIYVIGIVGGTIFLGFFSLIYSACTRRRRQIRLLQRVNKLRDLDIQLALEREQEHDLSPVDQEELDRLAHDAHDAENMQTAQRASGMYSDRPISIARPISLTRPISRSIDRASLSLARVSIQNTQKKKNPAERVIQNNRPLSVRDYVKQNPKQKIIRQDPASAKALKMLGVTAEQTQYKYDGSVNERMKKIATGAGMNNMYTTGLATAGLSNDIIEGFESRREKLERKRREREEKRRLKDQAKGKISNGGDNLMPKIEIKEPQAPPGK